VVTGEHILPYAGSVGEIVHLVVGEGEYLVGPAPPRVVQKISNDIGFQTDVRRLISKAAMAAILDAVRNTILDWSLRLEQAGIHGEGLSFSASEAQKAQSVVFNIGNIGNATGLGMFGNNANVSANIGGDVSFLAGKVDELIKKAEKALPKSELPADTKAAAVQKLAELKEEVASSNPSEGRLKDGLKALRRVLEGSASDLVAAGIEAAITALLG
jgi:hypothetical protein